MIISVNHRSKHKKEAGEIRCPYNQLGLIFDFVKNNPNIRYNITVDNDLFESELNRAIEQIDYIKAVAKDYTIECGDLVRLKVLLNRGYNTYLRFPVTDWQMFSDLRDIGVSDIYIDGPLCFDTEAIKKGKYGVKEGETIKIRVSPTISPSASIAGMGTNSFFIRPEDMSLYKEIVDVIDFHEVNNDKEDALFSIYNRGTFNYDINQLIPGLPQVSNLLITDEFAKTRLTCKKSCQIPGRSCHYCPHYFFVLEKSLEVASKE